MPNRVEFRCTRCERKKAPHRFDRDEGGRRKVCRRCESNAAHVAQVERRALRLRLERLAQGAGA